MRSHLRCFEVVGTARCAFELFKKIVSENALVILSEGLSPKSKDPVKSYIKISILLSMLCNRILGTTHHGTYKKVVDVPLLREELSARSIRCIARDGVEIEIDVYEDLQEGDIVAETDFNVYAIKIYVPKKKPAEAPMPKFKSYL